MLYIILVAQGRVITLVRPKKHSIHPAGVSAPPSRVVLSGSEDHGAAPDLHILINTAHSPSIINSSASASWLPLCLPKFDPAGFVNAYVTFIEAHGAAEPAGGSEQRDAGDERRAQIGASVGLLCASGN